MPPKAASSSAPASSTKKAKAADASAASIYAVPSYFKDASFNLTKELGNFKPYHLTPKTRLLGWITLPLAQLFLFTALSSIRILPSKAEGFSLFDFVKTVSILPIALQLAYYVPASPIVAGLVTAWSVALHIVGSIVFSIANEAFEGFSYLSYVFLAAAVLLWAFFWDYRLQFEGHESHANLVQDILPFVYFGPLAEGALYPSMSAVNKLAKEKAVKLVESWKSRSKRPPNKYVARLGAVKN